MLYLQGRASALMLFVLSGVCGGLIWAGGRLRPTEMYDSLDTLAFTAATTATALLSRT